MAQAARVTFVTGDEGSQDDDELESNAIIPSQITEDVDSISVIDDIMAPASVSEEQRPLLEPTVSMKPPPKLHKSVSRAHGLMKPEERPQDRYNFIYCIFFLMGLSTLLPWNFFISLTGFWDYRFRNVSAESYVMRLEDEAPKTELQNQFTSYLAIASNIPNALFVILNALYGQRFALRRRITLSLSGVIVLFIGVTALAQTNSDQWQTTFLIVILTLVVLVNVHTAVYQGAVFGVAGKFPPQFMGAAMAGQAVGGIFPAVVDIVITSLNVQEKDIGFWCFLIATGVLMVSLLLFLYSSRTAFFKYYAIEGVHEVSADVADVNDPPPSQRGPALSRVLHSLRHAWHYCLSVFLVFSVSLSVYPALTVLAVSQFHGRGTHSKWGDQYFNLVSNFLLFNVGDFVGRTLANTFKIPGRSLTGRWVVVILAFLRVIFVPLFIMCNTAPDSRTAAVWFNKDAEFIVIMALFALSNGYLGNICMLHGPKTEANSDLQEETAMILVACLVTGIGCGSFLSYPVLQLL